jgi:hypothetical protein
MKALLAVVGIGGAVMGHLTVDTPSYDRYTKILYLIKFALIGMQGNFNWSSHSKRIDTISNDPKFWWH